MKRKHSNTVQDDRAVDKVRNMTPSRVPARMEGVVKNAGIKEHRKEKKPRA